MTNTEIDTNNNQPANVSQTKKISKTMLVMKRIAITLIAVILLTLVTLAFFYTVFKVDLLKDADAIFATFVIITFVIFLASFIWFIIYPYEYSLKQKIASSKAQETDTALNSYRLVVSIILHITLIIQLIIVATPIKYQFEYPIDIFVFFELTVLIIFTFSIIYTVKHFLQYFEYKIIHKGTKVHLQKTLYGLWGIILSIAFATVILIVFAVINREQLLQATDTFILTKIPFVEYFYHEKILGGNIT